MSSGSGLGSGSERDERAEKAEEFASGMDYWFSMENPVVQEQRIAYLSWSRVYNVGNAAERPDRPPHYRSPRK